MKRSNVSRLFFVVALPFVSILIPSLAMSRDQEVVLREGARLSATTPSGTVGVVAGEGFARTYKWNGCSLESEMMARSQRWNGALGIYDPAGTGPLGALFGKLFSCKGISRTVVQEAQVHFSEKIAAERWIKDFSKQPFETVWSKDGLLVQWGVSASRQQLSMSVWQICISGQRPANLPGAEDEAIRLTRETGDGPLRHDCATVGEEQFNTPRS